jgi:hypothetical protein
MKWHRGVDWGYGKAATVAVMVDPATGERTVLSEEEQVALLEEHERLHLRAQYVMLERHRRATMMIDYRAATASPNTRAHWLREQRRVAIRVYQHAK